jgi:transcriptional regulator with XRE-family HTH domain
MPEQKNDRAFLASRLKEMREYLALSQEEVAQMLQIPRSAISLIENGERGVGAVELKRFAEIYKCSIDYLTGVSDTDKAVQHEIEHLARAASKLSPKDREELLRFAQFLAKK